MKDNSRRASTRSLSRSTRVGLFFEFLLGVVIVVVVIFVMIFVVIFVIFVLVIFVAFVVVVVFVDVIVILVMKDFAAVLFQSAYYCVRPLK